MSSENIMIWNVRGLNARARRNSVREFVVQERVSLLCLQETKMVNVLPALVNEMLGPLFDYCFLPSVGLSGGIVMAWRTDVWTMADVSVQQFSVTAKATLSNVTTELWWITVVYGPQEDAEKIEFLNSLVAVRAASPGAWLLCGDFNMIYKEDDKNNDRLDRRGMHRFRAFINRATIEELHLSGRRFSWSNRRDSPTLERLDRAFASPEWLAAHPNHLLKALSSDCSDHCPLLLHTNMVLWAKGQFRFEPFWTKLPDFLGVVAVGWSATLYHVDPFRATSNSAAWPRR
jgi:exonuclease III